MPRLRAWKTRNLRIRLARPHAVAFVMTFAAPLLAETPLASVTPAPAAATEEAAARERRGSARRDLPRQFTVELTRDGAMFADGARARTVDEVEAQARRALAAPPFFAGATVFADISSPQSLDAVLAVLKRAGFSTVRSVRRAAPAELSAAAPVFPPAVASVAKMAAPPAIGAAPSDTVAEPLRVEVLTVGLHVARPLGREPYRARLLRAFEKEFKAFARCHALASQRERNASFGVDLLVPTRGGRAKVRQSRTRLTGAEFHGCMQRAFENVVFEAPPTARPEMISYSLLFKPTTQ